MRAFVFLAAVCCTPLVLAQSDVIEATTAAGEKVRLLPNGRWEYADQKKAEVQRKAAETESAQKAEVQRKAAETESVRERNAQGGLFGIGRRIYEGDKDYNRGTLNPAKR